MNIDIDKTWLAIGLLGQALFSARFIVQWLQSERVKKSVIPSAFWYFSMAGGATLLAGPVETPWRSSNSRGAPPSSRWNSSLRSPTRATSTQWTTACSS